MGANIEALTNHEEPFTPVELAIYYGNSKAMEALAAGGCRVPYNYITFDNFEHDKGSDILEIANVSRTIDEIYLSSEIDLHQYRNIVDYTNFDREEYTYDNYRG